MMKKNLKWVWIGIGIILFIAGLSNWASRGGFMFSRGRASVPAGWKTSQDPMGFSVAAPEGWMVRSDSKSGRVKIQGSAGESIVIWPVFISAADGGGGILNPGGVATLARRLAVKVRPDVSWSPPQPAGPTAVRLMSSSGDQAIVSIFTWTPSQRGIVGYSYTIEASAAHYSSLEETFTNILASFRITGAENEQNPKAAINYVRWNDPRENAFSLEVPTGWQISGGMLRFASTDIRWSVKAVSNDGGINIRFGDTDIPTFSKPTPISSMSGLTEGSWYSPGYGVKMMISRYLTGKAFATQYVRTKVARSCPGLSITESRDITEAARTQSHISDITAGDVYFTCRGNAGILTGHYIAVTQQFKTSPGLWSMSLLLGNVAAPENVSQAESVMNHMFTTLQENPEWHLMQSKINGDTARIVHKTDQELTKIQADGFWGNQAIKDGMSRPRSNAMLGLEDVEDTVTGQHFRVESGSNYYHINHQGTIVGTDTDTSPGTDFRKLVPWHQ